MSRTAPILSHIFTRSCAVVCLAGACNGESPLASETAGSSGSAGDTPTCGDGVVDGDEACDDGNTDDADGCSASCQLEACDDGVAQATEACDDDPTGGAVECGNGVTEAGEACDDGNTAAGDGCSPIRIPPTAASSCCSWSCMPSARAPGGSATPPPALTAAGAFDRSTGLVLRCQAVKAATAREKSPAVYAATPGG